ncbi:MAG: hypothetical protein ACTHKH_13510, partial [Trinickia sp.]
LGAPANEHDRSKVYLDAMHACQLFAYRGRPKFYQDGHIIGDELPGDERAGVEVAMGPCVPGSNTREFVAIKRLDRGELPRGAESLLLERLLRAFGIVPKAFRLERAATDDVSRAVIETIEGLGLAHPHTKQAADYIEVHIEWDATAGTGTPQRESAADARPVSRSTSRSLPRDPVVDGRQVRSAYRQDSLSFDAGTPGPLVIGEPRFLVSHDNKTYLNGAIHAVDLDSIRTQADASCDEVRIRVGAESWNEAELTKLGREGARLLREGGRLVVSTGAQPHAPLEAFIRTLTLHGFSVSIDAPEETPFYPVISDPSAGGVTFECTKLPAQPSRKRARESPEPDEGPPRSKMRRPGAP